MMESGSENYKRLTSFDCRDRILCNSMGYGIGIFMDVKSSVPTGKARRPVVGF